MMKRLVVLLSLAIPLCSAVESHAGGWADFERFWGIHCGPGIHARNGCPGKCGAGGYGGGYPVEEVTPGEPEATASKSNRAPQAQRSSRTSNAAPASDYNRR